MAQKRSGETTYKETSFGIISRSELIPLEIEGIKKAWDFVLKKSTRGNIPFTPAFLRKVHEVGFAWIFPKMGGKFRQIEVSVSHHLPPKPYAIPQLMEDFTLDLKMRLKHLPSTDEQNFLKELICLLAWAHHRFLWIHPFTDYNGRIARLLNNIILLNLNLPPLELKVETTKGRKRYIEALQKADQADFTKLEKIFEAGLRESVKNW